MQNSVVSYNMHLTIIFSLLSQMLWSVDDLKDEVDKHQNAPCGQFYANLCAFDSDTLLDLVDMPPAAPPPPMLPDASLTSMSIKRVMASGGLDDGLDITSALSDCTDNDQTPCAALDWERPWLMFDLGAQYKNIYSARLFLMPPSPPKPPFPPPPPLPPPPPNDPSGFVSGNRRLDTKEIEVENIQAYLDKPDSPYKNVENMIASNSSGYERRLQDGTGTHCDYQVEGGKQYISNPGYTLSTRTIYTGDALECETDCVKNPICNFWVWEQLDDLKGTCNHYSQVDDYVDVKTDQTIVSGRCEPLRFPTAYHQPGKLEIYVSRSLALFGTRAAVIDTSTMHDGEATVYLNEGRYGDMAEGRYIYLRSFESNRQLRIDGFQVFVKPESGRRLDEQEAEQMIKDGGGAEDNESGRKGRRSMHEFDKTEDARIPQIPKSSMVRLYKMRNLTMATCLDDDKNPLAAKEARQSAAMLWAELSEEESGVGCTSCITYKPMNCTNWFQMPHGYRKGHSEELKKQRRKMQEKLDAEQADRKEALRDSLASGCCRVNKRTGEKQCGRQFCEKALKKAAEQRMAHVLRKLHERPTAKTNLNVNQLVSTDMVQPKLHHDPRCQTEKSRDDHGHVECFTSSVLKHLGDKHGFSESDLNKQMEKFGLNVADIVKAHIAHSHTNSKKKKYEFMSDPAKAHIKGEIRRAEVARRMLSNHVEAPPKRKAPRASWLKKSTRRGRRLSEASGEDASEPLIGVERLALSPKDLRMRRKLHDDYIKNQSYAAKGIVRAANLAVATTGAQKITMSGLIGAAWESSLASDSSIIGRAHSIMNTVGKMGQKASDIANSISEAKEKMYAPPPPPTLKKRKLSEKEEAYFQKVESQAGKQVRGFKVPDHVQEQWGWVSEAADWVYWHDEAHRVGRILYQRHEWVQQHAEETGTLPVGELPDEHKTGYTFLDINAPPTGMGAFVRSMFTGGQRHAPHRNLREKRALSELPRASPPEGYVAKSLIGSFIDAAVNDEDPLEAAWTALHYNDHKTTVRRLAESSGWVAQETMFAGIDFADLIFGKPSGEVPGKSQIPGYNYLLDPIQQVSRYVVYDTLLCYLYPPPSVAGGPFGDGTPIKLHYSNRACFPMIPYIPPEPPKFNEALGFDANFDWNSLEYNNSCDSAAVKALIGPMMGELTATNFIAAPYGSILRFAEGIDSIRNLIKTGQTGLSQKERGTALVCSIAQLGGVLWMALFTLFAIAFSLCTPIGAWILLAIYRFIRGKSRRDREREEAIDNLLDSYGQGEGDEDDEDIGALPKRGKKIAKRRIGPQGHVLLGDEPSV